jgi:hypothetical protein
MARKLCTTCNYRAIGTGPISIEDMAYAIDQDMCGPCGDEGQHFIAHHNNDHEDLSTDDCWYCHPEKDLSALRGPIKAGHTNTAAKTWSSHAECSHDRTPKARATCRKARV